MTHKKHLIDVDPDPLSALLIVLSAVGSITSIIAYAEQKSSQIEFTYRRAGRKALDSLTLAEVSLTEIDAQSKSLQILLASGTKYLRSGTWRNAPVSFGSLELHFSNPVIKRWKSLVTQLHRSSIKLQRGITDLLTQLASSEYKISAETAHGISELNERLNNILFQIGRSDLGTTVDNLGVTIELGQVSLHQLRLELENMFG